MKYTDLELQVLIDLLVQHTNDYTKKTSYSAFTVEELAHRKQTLAEIQQAIKLKIEQGSNTMKNIIPDLPDYIINLPQNPAPNENAEKR